jgi:hypothetical protein
MTLKFHSLALLACLAAAAPGLAAARLPAKPAPMTKQMYEAEKAKIETEAKVDLKLCATLKGSRKDVCEVESKGRAEALKAELEARYKPSPEANQKAKYVTADANFAVAKAKCRALKGDNKDHCMSQAKLAREAAIRQAKVEKVQETGGPFAASGAAAHRKLQPGAS